MTAVGDAGEGSRGSAPPKALLLLPPLTFCGGIVGQLKIIYVKITLLWLFAYHKISC